MLVLLGIALYLGVLLVVPLGALAGRVLRDFGEVVVALRSPPAVHALWLSVRVAAACVLINGVVGVAGALLLVRQRFFGRKLLDALIDLPLAVSPVMTGLAFLLLFGRTGIAHPLLEALHARVAFAPAGVLLATLFVTLPFTLREVALVLEEKGEDEEEAAATLGASSWRTFWFVTLPNVREGLVTGAGLTLARALGEFGAVLVVGGAIAMKTDTATTFIHTAVDERQEAAGYGMALVLAAIAVLVLLAFESPRRRPRRKEEVPA